jgi:hypothetical protein
LKVLEICVMPDKRRIKLTVEMPDPDRFLTSQVPHVPRGLFRMLPRLGKHTCHNDRGVSFKQECRQTEIPHLFEHLIIELQLQAQQQETDYLTGETEWDWQVDPRGYYHVYVDYDNELLAVGAIRLAERVLRSLDHKDVSVNIDEEMGRLRELLRLGRELEGPRQIVEVEEKQPARTWASINFASPELA